MRTLYVLTIFVYAMALAFDDFVCNRDYCKEHPCTTSLDPTSCTSPSIYRANHAGKCACCPACITLLNQFESCEKYDKELGKTPSAICHPPFKCLAGTCFFYL